MSGNHYKTALMIVQFQDGDLPGAWRGDGLHGTKELMNLAFKVYYRGIKGGKNSIKEVMAAAEEGWGWGKEPSDLAEALDYLYERCNVPWWGFTSRVTYTGVLVSGSVSAPKSVVHFMDEIGDRMNKVVAAGNALDSVAASLTAHLKNRNWEQIRSDLDEVQTWASRVDSYLWMAPDSVQATVGDAAGTAVTFVDALQKVHEGMTVAADMLSDRGRRGNAEAGMKTIGTAVSYLPVLGTFYAKALDAFPGIVANFEAQIDKRKRILDDAANGIIRNYQVR